MKLWRRPFDQNEEVTTRVRVVINKDRYKGCGYCVEFCPRQALEMSEEMNAKGYLLPMIVEESKCLGCGLCEVICPDFGLHVMLLSEGD